MDEATLKGAKILMVDDEVVNTCLMENFLSRIGYANLESLNDSRKIFETIERFTPDLILLDLMMPGINGFDVLEAFRRDGMPDEQVPVLVISGDATAANKRRALRSGATDLLAKPFDPSEVNMRIRSLLQARFLRLEIEEQNRVLETRVQERTAQLEAALEDLRAASAKMVQQERLSAFGEMAGGVVHDFSNALMAIIGYSEMLLTNPTARTDDVVALDYLRIINTAGRDGAHVVGRLRDFYRPRGNADIFEPLDLNEIARQSIALARPRSLQRAAADAISFESDLAFSVRAIGLGAELREALTNLISNAVDAISGPGTVTVRTREDADMAIIEVQDTGAGMSAEVQARCLEPFFSTKGDHGTGLGLAMVFGIIQRHQGRMEIESEPGAGAIFRIRLPLAPTNEAAEGEEDAAVPDSQSLQHEPRIAPPLHSNEGCTAPAGMAICQPQ